MRNLFDNLVGLQSIGCFGAGFLGGWSLFAYGFSEGAIVPLLLALIAYVVSWIAPQVVHELIEINDQLAGRSPEFHKRLGEHK